MVHGGGHHSINYHEGGDHSGGAGSSSDGGRNHDQTWDTSTGWMHRHHTTDVVVVNNYQPTNYEWNSYQRTIPVSNRSGDEECERCCRSCCTAHSPVDSVRERPHKSNSSCPPITIPIIVFVIALILSNMRDEWTLNAGETRQIPNNAWLHNQVSISTNIQGSASIYSMNGACPPLTGPTVSFGQTEDLTLSEDDYQYDYFYLNTGSFLDVTFTQDYGATNVFVLRGLRVALSHDNSFSSAALLTRYAGAGQTANVQYSALASDTYTVIYDNASNSNGHATVTYQVTLTTYNLDGVTPVSDCEGSVSCSIDVRGRTCILVKATDEVTVHVSASRRWGPPLRLCHPTSGWASIPATKAGRRQRCTPTGDGT
ncbi:hypothetical protein MHU86_4809 [Fragilaria crotonensis]|nr:hypothetical protein MHU86_4809 [Fragilaria crotonensis]